MDGQTDRHTNFHWLSHITLPFYVASKERVHTYDITSPFYVAGTESAYMCFMYHSKYKYMYGIFLIQLPVIQQLMVASLYNIPTLISPDVAFFSAVLIILWFVVRAFNLLNLVKTARATPGDKIRMIYTVRTNQLGMLD